MNMDNLFNRIKNSLFTMHKGSPFRNLVFKGGGVRGIAYMGALEVLEEEGILADIERVAGTSSGAIAATVVSFRLNCEDTMGLFNTLDLKKSPPKNGQWQRAQYPHSQEYRKLYPPF